MALAMAGVLFASCAISASAAPPPVTIKGKGTTTQDPSTGLYNANQTADLENNPASINVQAKTSGGAEIVYNLTISWGDMQFEYDFGGQWSPSSHTYSIGDSGKLGGGWIADGVNGTNNAITVDNDSNFPMTATFSFDIEDTLNPDSGTTSAGAVVGIFSTDNSTFATTSSSGVTSTTPLLDAGYNGNGISNKTTGSLNLEMVATALTTGQIYYATTDSATSDETTSIKSMYFALSGSCTSYGAQKVP